MHQKFNLVEIVKAALRWYKPISIVTLIVLIATFVVTMPAIGIFQPKYEAEAKVFPINPATSDAPYLFSPEQSVDLDFETYGDKHDLDRLIAIARSDRVISDIVQEFNLFDHYDIDTTTTKYPFTKAMGKFDNLYEVFKNEQRAIEIHVKDKDKGLAARIANAIPAKINAISQEMLQSNKQKIAQVLDQKQKEQQREIAQLQDTLQSISSSQKPVVKAQLQQSKEQLQHFAKLQSRYSLLGSSNLPALQVMQKAHPPEKPLPTRWYLIIGATLFTLFILSFLAVILELVIKPNR